MKSPLPTVAGVGSSSQWLPSGPWKTVLEFFQEQFPRVDLETWIARMDRGEVVDETGVRVAPESVYRVGACIFYYREVENESVIPFVEQVLYRDEHILVADKPHFLPVIPSGRFLHETLLVRLRKNYGAEDLVPVHRLDRETAGVVLFSLDPSTRGKYTSLFRNREVTKVYEALAPTLDHAGPYITRRSRIVRGEPFFRMKEVAGIPNSETKIVPLQNLGVNTVYRLIPVTGRKHQLRVHLAGLGIPIINDKLYPVVSSSDEDDFSSPLELVARSLSFQDPITGHQRNFESEMNLSGRHSVAAPCGM
ncbi:MAG: pseudouridine synthase [Acidobacteria bacterium]|nr:MAG: pseudouridine synthase [Acidobacteriota bacterium]